MELATVPAAATATMTRRRSACSDDSEDYEFNSALSEAGSEESYDFCSLTSKDTASGSEFGAAGYGEHQSVLSEEKLSVICVHSASDEDEENAEVSSQHHTIFTATDPSTDFDDEEQENDNDTARDDDEEQQAEEAEEEDEEAEEEAEEEEEGGLQVYEQDSLITEHEIEYQEEEEEDEDEDEEAEPMEVEDEGCAYNEEDEEAQSEEDEEEEDEDSDDEEEEDEDSDDEAEDEEESEDDVFSTAELAAELDATTQHNHALHGCSPRSRQMEDIDFILQMLGLALDTVSATSISRRVRECEPATCMGCGAEFPSRTQLRKHLMRAKSCRRAPRKLKEQIHEFQERYGACLSLLNEAQKRAYVTLLYARALQIRIQH